MAQYFKKTRLLAWSALAPLVLVCAACASDGGNDTNIVEQKVDRQTSRVGDKVDNRVDHETDEAVDSVVDKVLDRVF